MNLIREINPDLIYGYIPTSSVCILFVALYLISTGMWQLYVLEIHVFAVYSPIRTLVTHFGQAIHYRYWFLLPTIVLAGAGECLGWSARLWSSKTFLGSAQTPYTIQYVTFSLAQEIC